MKGTDNREEGKRRRKQRMKGSGKLGKQGKNKQEREGGKRGRNKQRKKKGHGELYMRRNANPEPVQIHQYLWSPLCARHKGRTQ